MFDYILILGGPLDNEKPSPLLFERIKKGARLAEENPGAKIVVSGGIKGETQRLSEAEIMKNSLLELGISEDRIILEDKAKTTLQNFIYTNEITGNNLNAAFVTNKFHIWRSKRIMKAAGVDYTAIPAPNGNASLGFRIRELPLRLFALFGKFE